METTPRALLIPLSTEGHWKPVFSIIQHLAAHKINVTVCTSQDRADEMRQYEARWGNFRNADVEVVVVFSTTKSVRLSPELFMTMEKGLELKKNELKLDRFSCIIADTWISNAQDVADELGIPHYRVIPTACHFGISALQAETIVNRGWCSANSAKKDQCIDVPGLEIFNVIDLTWSPRFCKLMIDQSIGMRKDAGILFNTFEELEPKSLDFFRCQLEDNAIGIVAPKVFSIGPLMSFSTLPSIERSIPEPLVEYMNWLDKRQKSSVLFICLGTHVEVPVASLTAIAKALESTEVSFLWALRLPQQTIKEGVFPHGFETRMYERGLIVTDWVAQQDILHHPSIGAFLSHCGWNSCLESIIAGVPIVAHPMGVDQHMNAKFLVTIARVAVGITQKSYHEDGQIDCAREDLADVIRTLMLEDEGEGIKLNMLKLQQAALKATAEGGSSHRAFHDLIDEIRRPRHIRT